MVANSDDETHTSNEPLGEAAAPQRLVAPLQTRDPDRYDILGEHGRGGLGKVARAHDKELGRHVAIKELITRSGVGEVRFLREAMITARLEHPSIVPIHEAGRWPDGTPFYVMKLVAGRSLKELLAERKTVEQRIELLPHVVAVADAVAYAHERKIIHRDLKPANVIVGDFGETVVIDWGLAKDLSQPDEPAGGGPYPIAALTDLTETGTVLGTPTYMAPEQFRGEAVDQRADVFAIGAMLWELCSTSKVPPVDPRHRDRLLRKAGIDKDLGAILAKALSVEPEQRYRDAGELSADLRAFIAGARIASRRYSLLGLAMHWIRRHRALTAAIAVATVLALTGTFIYVRNITIARGRADAAAIRADLERMISSVEQGRQALLLGNTAQAAEHLGEAYKLGDRSWSTEFMYARALEPQEAELARFQSLKGRMWSTAYSPDERQIVTTDEGGAQIWDARTYQRLYTLPHADVVYAAVYTSDGARVVTSCGDGAVRIWDAQSGTLVRELRADGPPKRWHELDVSGDRVAAISFNGRSVYAWNATTGAVVASSHGEKDVAFSSLAFSPDGRWLAASVSEEGRVFETATWKQAASFPGAVRAFAWHPTGARLGTGSPSGEISIWEIPSLRQVRIRETGSPVDIVAMSRDGKLVATAERDGTARVWDAETGAQRSVSARPVRIRSMAFDATSTQLALAASDGSVRVVEALSGLPLATLDGAQDAIWSIRFASSASHVLAASWDGSTRLWSARSLHRQWASARMTEECAVYSAAVPDQRYVIVGCENHATRVWDTVQDRLLAELRPMPSKMDGDFAPVLPVVSENGSRAAIAHGNLVGLYELPGGRLVRTIDHGAEVTAVAFGRRGDVVSGAADGALWRTPDGQRSIALPTASAGIDAVALLADGRVVSVDAAKKLRVISSRGIDALDTPTRIALLRPSPDGSKLVTIQNNTIPSLTGRGDAAVLWDLRGPHLVSALSGQKGRVFTARWSADRVLTTASDGTVRLWNGTTGRAVTVYKAQVRRFLADAAISSDGAILAAGGADGLVEFWDFATGRALWALRAHTGHVMGLHFDGPDLVTRGFGGEVVRWRFTAASEVVRRKALR